MHRNFKLKFYPEMDSNLRRNLIDTRSFFIKKHMNLFRVTIMCSIHLFVGFAFGMLCWGSGNFFALWQLHWVSTKECKCEMLKWWRIFPGYVSRVSSNGNVRLFLFFIYILIFYFPVQKRHRFQPYYKKLLRRPYYSTGTHLRE